MTIQPDERKSNLIHDRSRAESYGLAIDTTYAQYLKYALLERHARPEDICLDIGIATGLFSIPLAPKVRHIHGVDISVDMVEICRQNLAQAGIENITVHEQSATALQFDDAAFDLVYCFSTLLLIPDVGRAFQEINRVLKPGGKAVLDITGKHNLSRLHWGRYYRRQAGLELQAFTLAEIRARFDDLGLDVLETHATGFLDQWKYVPLLKYAAPLNRIFHASRRSPDLDYQVSQRLPRLANRWYLVLSKRHAARA